MAHVIEDRVLEISTSVGTGSFVTTGAASGFRRLSDVCAISDTFPYYIEAIDANGVPTGEYEYGRATYTALNTFDRTTIYGSSNAGSAVVFSTGSKNVGLAIAAPQNTQTRADWRSAIGAPASGAITASGLTMATSRLLGRGTAGTGALEELSLASTLELLTGVLGVKAASIGPAQLSGAQSGSAPVFGARAWFCADGTLTGTNSPLAGGNAVSVTRNSVGNFTFTWSTEVNINFAFSISGGDGNGRSWSEISRTKTSIRLVLSDASVAYDAALLSLIIFSQS